MSDSIRILLVDDECRLTEGMSLYLQKNGCRVQSSHLGADALKQIQENTFDIVLLDLSLPDISGYEVLEHLRGFKSRPSVIVLTGIITRDSVVRCLKLGAYDYLYKPFELEDLNNRIRVAYEYRQLELEKEKYRLQVEKTDDLYRFLVDSSPEIIFTLDGGGRFSFLSKSVTRYLGWAPTELMGMPFDNILHPGDAADFFGPANGSLSVAVRLMKKNSPPDSAEFLTFEMKIFPLSGNGKNFNAALYGSARLLDPFPNNLPSLIEESAGSSAGR